MRISVRGNKQSLMQKPGIPFGGQRKGRGLPGSILVDGMVAIAVLIVLGAAVLGLMGSVFDRAVIVIDEVRTLGADLPGLVLAPW